MPLNLFRFVSLRFRFMIVAVLLTLVFSSVWGVWTWNRERNLLFDRVVREGEMLVSSMAIPIINAQLYEEMGIISEGGLIDNFVADIMANARLKPHYAFVTDQEGRVIAHNQLPEFGKVYEDDITHRVLVAPDLIVSRLEGKDGPLLDFGMPLAIAGKRWGSLRVGVSLLPLQKELSGLKSRILGFTILFAIGAMGAFILIGNRLSSPLIELAGKMEKVPDTARTYQPDHYRRDEIGQLQQSFARLVDRLNRTEEERNRTFERLLDNERLATVGKLVSGVAHEVNNPLAGIEGALFHLRKTCGNEASQYVDVVQRSVDRIGGIVRQLLDLSRAGRLERDLVNSDDLFNEIDNFSRMALKPLRVTYRSRNIFPTRQLCLDRDKIYQVVLNLILNAADAAKNSSNEPVVDLLVYEHNQNYCIQVTDNGPGVPVGEEEKIFELFYTTKPPGEGTGIGLAICRSIVENHGGSIRLLDNEDQGATFLVKVPTKTSDCCENAKNDRTA